MPQRFHDAHLDQRLGVMLRSATGAESDPRGYVGGVTYLHQSPPPPPPSRGGKLLWSGSKDARGLLDGRSAGEGGLATRLLVVIGNLRWGAETPRGSATCTPNSESPRVSGSDVLALQKCVQGPITVLGSVGSGASGWTCGLRISL